MFKKAAIFALPKGVRSLMQFLGAGLIAIPVVASFADLKTTGVTVLLVLTSAFIGGVGAFAQNYAEELERLDRPTGIPTGA